MQAATGPVCFQIRQQIAALGPVQGRILVEEGRSENTDQIPAERNSWAYDIFKRNYAGARATLEEKLKSDTGEDALSTEAWLAYCTAKASSEPNLASVKEFAARHGEVAAVQGIVGLILRIEGHTVEALELLAKARARWPDNPGFVLHLAACHKDQANPSAAITELQHFGPDRSPEVAISLAESFERDGNMSLAYEVVRRCYARNPSDKAIRFKYARLAQELDDHPVAAHLFSELIHLEPESHEYWGYLGNSCLQLDFLDKALEAYRKAASLAADGQLSDQWIIGNIGNLLSVAGLPTEACSYFDQALKNEPRSEYLHDRLAGALKKISALEDAFKKKCEEGKRAVSSSMRADLSLEITARFKGSLADAATQPAGLLSLSR